ncbi:flagellar motor stator protein MotA [Helicobacter mastomyrinus]|uniref:Flagellar motor stator protein MotA n=3 Tax=Helicobacter TaxID=209 RepID=A0ABZ3F7D1_9HELI|nr:flagellar motor stator protein MotA [uncultured Helicobacter sp.]
MDLTSILGLLGAVASLSLGDILEGGNPLHLIHISSLIIIIPTAGCAAMAATHGTHVKAAFKEMKLVFGGSGVNLNETIRTLVELSTLARKDGVLSLEGKAAQIEDDFLRQALSMIIDGRDAHAVREDMEVQIESLEEYYHGSSHFWIMYAETCPTMGLVGAVMGLMLALQLLDDPKAMAAGIAGAFTATVTGIFCSYGMFGPWGHKMHAKSKDIIRERMVILEGVVGIANGDNPRNLEEKLLGFIPPGEPKISQFE